MNRQERILEGIAAWASFYRANPHRFAKDYLHLDLHLFQKILLVMMNICTSFVFIASRGLGKTFLSAIFCCIRCILYPGTKICIASGTRGQGINVLEKIMTELKPVSTELCNEIDEKQSKINGTNAQIVFKNGSFIKVVTANDNARGNRANILLIDEYRMVPKDIIDTILRKFLTNPRMPGYLKKPEYRHLAERNKTLYLSSAYFKDHWSYTKAEDNYRFMVDDKRNDFVCGFPYQLAIREGLLFEEDVADQMAESDFSEVKWSMEMDALFFGDSDGTFFDFNSVSKNRRIKYPMLPDKLASKLGNTPKVRIQPKQNGEVRILSADIALMSSKKHNNDASAIFINQLLPTKVGRYSSNIVYCDAAEGLHTGDQALMIRRLYEEYQCDYIVLDCVGIGLGVYDALVREITDPDTGDIYPALTCCNNAEMAERCTTKGAEKAIWAIKGNPTLNSECAVLLREGFRSGKIRLLMTEYDGEALLSEIRGYNSLNPPEKLALQMPYVHTTLLINELVKLQHEEVGGKVKIHEKSGMRKDRYSSLSYNFYVATQLESRLSKRMNDGFNMNDIFVFKPPKNHLRKGGGR
ncbi:terminase large subunit domain-containing protein [Flavonifractor plautii]|uniref:terminase large subunit domain-containing protein n=1 Tax=Flavonifractor plautii TaxID=292800 RepID=UPI0018AA4559|nr:terminase large subunit [Flavonifractor plautii]